MGQLEAQIFNLRERCNKVHMHMNARDSTIVKDVTDEIEGIIHKVFYNEINNSDSSN